ncbi:MAG TPA: rhomboid family intramembrane serine protease [Vicinamibacteria bacterium]|nr:rhomboid family intramembrane serine protease [Vicinamibacteria bacterium]
MFGRQRTGSTLCPSCGMLVGVNDEQCLGCGRRRPGLFGFAGLLGRTSLDDLFVPFVMWTCGALYLVSLGADPSAVGSSGLMSLLSPGLESLFVFGASGAVPVFGYGRWWTPLSAPWLHGGVLHIVFNMMAVRDLGPAVAHIYGGSRTIVIYTVSGAAGFLASSVAGAYLTFLPGFLRGASITVGASAGVFGLLGAVLHYGYRGGSAQLRELATRWIITGLLFGFFLPRIDNWAHLGGLFGGYLASFWLDPLSPERGTHTVWALACVVLSVLAVLVSVVTGLPVLRGE